MFFNKVKLDEQQKDVLDKAIAYLETSPHLEYNPDEDYPALIRSSLHLLETDFEYSSNHAYIEGKGTAPEKMSVKEIGTMLTFFNRNERFNHGVIAEAVNSGTLLKVLRRLKDISK